MDELHPIIREALGSHAPYERQAAGRFSYSARAIGEYAADCASPHFEGQICDLSLNGAGLVLDRPLGHVGRPFLLYGAKAPTTNLSRIFRDMVCASLPRSLRRTQWRAAIPLMAR